ncbi:hypothetical protein LBMAG42_08340 [Deltaproteobacteria bacterium]|nr:hypothetical protein LBMAG42_08340 [Deltaproteobacteria bacterium]
MAGADLSFTVWSEGTTPDGWSLVSDDTSVVDVEVGDINTDGDVDFVQFGGRAIGAGSATLTVLDAFGAEVATADVTVAMPTRVELRSATDLEVDEEAAALGTPKVVVGGETTFQVKYFDGDTLLHGAGAARVDGDDARWDVESNFLGDELDWIVVRPDEAGVMSTALSVAGTTVATVSIEGVDAEAIAAVVLKPESEEGAEKGDARQVIAWAEDAAGEKLYGAPFAWTERGDALDGVGDQYGYEFLPGVSSELVAEVNGVSATTTVHGRGSVDRVNCACAVANVGPIGGAIALALLGIVRRRGRGNRG